MTDKVIRDGMVAVLVSPGYGAGWSTWNDERPDLVFSPAVVEWIEGGKEGPSPFHDEVDVYDGGLRDIEIVWLPVGTHFRIDEYDGSESITLASEEVWTEA